VSSRNVEDWGAPHARLPTLRSPDVPACPLPPELHNDGEDVFVLVDGLKIAKRGRPDTAQAMTWIMLEPG
jgi:hypothetical protein